MNIRNSIYNGLNRVGKVEAGLAYQGTNRSIIPGVTSIKRKYNNWRAKRAGSGTEKMLRGLGVGKDTAKFIGSAHREINAFKRNNSQLINKTQKAINSVRNNVGQADHVNEQRQAMAAQQQINAQNRVINQQQAQQRYSLIYDESLKSFSMMSSSTRAQIKNVLLICGVTTAIKLIPKIIKVYVDRYGTRNLDLILNRRNKNYERLSNNYKESNAIDTSKTEELRKELHALVEDTIRLNKINDKDKTVYSLYIAPFIAVLALVLVKGVYVIHGTDELKQDREDFQLVLCPNASDFKEVLRTPFRQVLFKYKWPAHGFKVSTLGASEANKLISYTIDFLAEHPQYLVIRV